MNNTTFQVAVIAIGAAAIFTFGFTAYLRHRRAVAKHQAELQRIENDRLAASPPLVCGCEHHLSFHDPETGACHGENHHKRYQDALVTRWNTHACRCRQYSGPAPIDNVYIPDNPTTGRFPLQPGPDDKSGN